MYRLPSSRSHGVAVFQDEMHLDNSPRLGSLHCVLTTGKATPIERLGSFLLLSIQ
jgi:hypothetical protein